MSTKTKDISYINWHQSRGLHWVRERGYHWFQDRFYPALMRLEKSASTKKDRMLLSDVWYMIGDVHDFNDAPKAAIRAYKKSIGYDPFHGGSYGELGSMYQDIGEYGQAVRSLEKAIAILPDDERIKSLLESAQEDLECPGPPVFEEKDWTWQIRELLARRQFKKAIRELENRRSVQAAQYRACAYAGLNFSDKVLNEWRNISRLKGRIRLELIDLFYLEDIVFEGPDFWKSMALCGNRFWQEDFASNGAFWGFDSLRTLFPRDKSVDWHSAKYRIRIEQMHDVFVQYQLARMRKDAAMARRLSDKYPTWPEAAELALELESRVGVRKSK